MDYFTSWVRWHGPFRSVDDWVDAARDEASNERMRLYVAIGRAKRISVKASQILYVGMNGKRSENPLHDEIKSKRAKQFRGLFNEFWLGELLSQFASEDSDKGGLSKNTERALIYALNPLQNLSGYLTPPDFSFRVVNILALRQSRRLFRTRFERLIPSYIELDLERRSLFCGTITLKVRDRWEIERLERERSKRKKRSYEGFWTQRFAEEPDGIRKEKSTPLGQEVRKS